MGLLRDLNGWLRFAGLGVQIRDLELDCLEASFKFRSLDLHICGFDLLTSCSLLAFGHLIMSLSKFTLNEILKDPP